MKKLLTIFFAVILTQGGFGQNDLIRPLAAEIANEYGEPDEIKIYGIKYHDVVYEWKYGLDTVFRIQNDTVRWQNFNYSEYISKNHPSSIVSSGTLSNSTIKKYKVIDFSTPSDIKIDTTIFIDGTVSNDTNIKIINYSALFSYYSKHIVSPPHGDDPNYATVSFIIDTLGHVNYVYIIEDVINKTNDEPWKWYDDNGFQFSPLIVNGKPYIVEYQIKIDDLCYCAPLIYKEHKARKRKEKRKRK